MRAKLYVAGFAILRSLVWFTDAVAKVLSFSSSDQTPRIVARFYWFQGLSADMAYWHQIHLMDHLM